MDQEPGFSTWSQALVLTSCSVIPFATQLLPGYIKEQSTFHLKHTQPLMVSLVRVLLLINFRTLVIIKTDFITHSFSRCTKSLWGPKTMRYCD